MLTYPDWGAYQSNVISPEGDLGEVIARLGGPRYRREGRILSYADCSPNLDGWKLSTPGVTIWTEYGNSYVGIASIHAFGPSSASPYVKRWIPMTISRRIGLEFFTYQENTQNSLVYAEIEFLNGTQGYLARFSLNGATGDIYYWNNSGGWTFLTTTNVIQMINNWYNFKMVADGDASTPVYARMIINNQEIAITQPLWIETLSPATYGTAFKVTFVSEDTINNYSQFIDGITITTNER